MTVRGVVKAVIAIVIIVAGAAIGWAIANATNPYATPTASVAASTNGNAAGTVVPNTPLPTFTPAFATTPQAGAAAGTPGAGGTPRAGQGQAGQGQNAQRARPITGTVESYDPATKLLTIKDTDGKSQKIATGNATVTKSQKVAADEFGKLAGGTGVVLLTGEKGSDGVYTARSLTAIDVSGFARGGQTGGAAPAGGFGGAGGNPLGGGGANAPVIIRGGTLADNKFTGKTFTGEDVTATISPTTSLLKQAAGTLEDLKAGVAITVTARAAQGNAPAEAQVITLT